MNECALGRHNCYTGATCVNTIGAYECTCQEGRTGHFCDEGTCRFEDSTAITPVASVQMLLLMFSVSDIDECKTDNGGCLNGATCVNTDGSFNCECPDEYLGLFCDECEDLKILSNYEY